MSVATETDLRAIAERGAAELGPDATAEQVLAWAAETFGERLIVASNMQDAVLVDLAATAQSGRRRAVPRDRLPLRRDDRHARRRRAPSTT